MLRQQMNLMNKWRLKDKSHKVLCESCSSDIYKDLDIRIPWKADPDIQDSIQCDQCGIYWDAIVVN